MTMHDEHKPLNGQDRLRLTGSKFERMLLRAAILDGPPERARDRLCEALAQVAAATSVKT